VTDLPLEVQAERLRMVLAEAGYPRAVVTVEDDDFFHDVHTITWSRDPNVQAVPPDVLKKAWTVIEGPS
jgi:hypothetical protein